MVGGENDRVFVPEAVDDLADAVAGGVDRAEIFVAQPAVCMAGCVRPAEVEEGESDSAAGQPGFSGLTELRAGLLVAVCAARQEQAFRQRAGTGEVAQLLPVVQHRGGVPIGVQALEQARDGTHLRHIGIGQNSVPSGVHAVEQRHMAGQRDRRHHGPRAEGIAPLPHQAGSGGVRVQSVRPHPVAENQQHLHKSNPLFLPDLTAFRVWSLPHYSPPIWFCQP